MSELKIDCRHFPGDRPCRFHKEEGVKCRACSYYAPVQMKVLIIKLGAPGDVLRTTPVLREIRRRHSGAHITWITAESSKPLLEGNPDIDRLWVDSSETQVRLHIEKFDLVLSLDNSGECAALATLARGEEKKGFGINEKGQVEPFTVEARQWLEMAAFDDVKKANRRTYQDVIFSVCGYAFDPEIHEIRLCIQDEDRTKARRISREYGLEQAELIVGMNVGAGKRWPMKRWSARGFVALSEVLMNDCGARILLLGGPEEEEIIKEIKRESGVSGTEVIDSGCSNPVKTFAGIVDLCDIVVTGDTLAMHIATGLKKHVVTLFGPTSAAEIELYGRGEKVVSDMPCRCCYRQVCNVTPYCVESISTTEVLNAVKNCITERLKERNEKRGHHLVEL